MSEDKNTTPDLTNVTPLSDKSAQSKQPSKLTLSDDKVTELPTSSRSAVKLSLTIKDKAVLYATYMPFIKNGALFIPTNREYQMGDPVSMTLTLLEEPSTISVDGQVVWITPNGAQGNRAPGVGVQFIGEAGVQLRNKIETVLAGSLKADRPTHTM